MWLFRPLDPSAFGARIRSWRVYEGFNIFWTFNLLYIQAGFGNSTRSIPDMLSFFSLSSEKLQETRSAKDAATLKKLYLTGFLFTLYIAINIFHFQINEVLSFQYRNFSNGNLPPFGTFRGQKRPFLSQGQPITSYFQGHNFQCSMNILA